jgi:hypothetical protein
MIQSRSFFHFVWLRKLAFGGIHHTHESFICICLSSKFIPTSSSILSMNRRHQSGLRGSIDTDRVGVNGTCIGARMIRQSGSHG